MASLRQLFALAKRTDSNVRIEILDDNAEEVALVFTLEPDAATFFALVREEWSQARQDN